MSRHNFDDLWDFYILAKEHLCLCCKEKIMVRDDHSTWRRGHVIHHKRGGPDILENLRPICLDCNKDDTYKKGFPDSYAYMVKIGTMSEEERQERLATILLIAEKGPDILECNATLQNGRKCTNNRKPFLEKCGQHGSTIREDFKKLLMKDYMTHKRMYEFLLYEGDDEELWRVKQMMDESWEMYSSI